MISISLTKGYVAIVDDEDAWVAELKWQADDSFSGTHPERQKMRWLIDHPFYSQALIRPR